jgi:hypothetical protein
MPGRPRAGPAHLILAPRGRAAYFAPVSWYDTLLFIHVVAAFLAVAGVVMFGAFYAATGGADSGSPLLRLSSFAIALWNVGGVGTIVFGIWLAFYVSAYEVWDGWIIAAIVLWVIASAAGARVGVAYRKLQRGEGARATAALHVVLAASVALLLIDMIYKPGA